MVFNGGTIPWYITMVNYGMIDSMIGLILCGGLPVFNLILIINFFRSLPDSLEEAAVVDGAGPWRILFSIVVPCSVPVLPPSFCSQASATGTSSSRAWCSQQ